MQSSLKRYFTSTAALSAFIGFLVLFCVLIYGLRSSQRHVYGLFETAFGLACIWEGLDPHRDAKTAGAVVIAGIYIVMRGIDNTRLGWKEQEDFRAARKLEKDTKRASATAAAVPGDEGCEPEAGSQ